MRDERYYSMRIAIAIGRISRGQAASWARKGTFVPSLLYGTKFRPYTYIYSFADLVALRVISILRDDYGVSLANAFFASDYTRGNTGASWSQMCFWVSGKQILLSDPLDASAQRIELEPIAIEVQKEADKLWNRNPDDYGKVERKRNVMHGTLVVKGTRIPVSTVVALVDAGWDIDRIRQGYPSLHPEDIRGVMQYVEEHQQVA